MWQTRKKEHYMTENQDARMEINPTLIRGQTAFRVKGNFADEELPSVILSEATNMITTGIYVLYSGCGTMSYVLTKSD